MIDGIALVTGRDNLIIILMRDVMNTSCWTVNNTQNPTFSRPHPKVTASAVITTNDSISICAFSRATGVNALHGTQQRAPVDYTPFEGGLFREDSQVTQKSLPTCHTLSPPTDKGVQLPLLCLLTLISLLMGAIAHGSWEHRWHIQS